MTEESIKRRLVRLAHSLREELQPPGAKIHEGRRATCYVALRGARRQVRKVFSNTPEGRAAFENERQAAREFESFAWMPSWTDEGPLWFTRRLYSARGRLDRLARGLTPEERAAIAGEALSILLDLYERGYAHRDFHSYNLYRVGGGLKLVDFEFLIPYPAAGRPDFLDSYDVTGRGLPSPGNTLNVGFATGHPKGVSHRLDVTLNDAVDRLRLRLAEELRAVSSSAFDSPMLRVDAGQARRDSQRRLERFGVTGEMLRDRRILDLGSEAGSLLFQAQRYGPKECLGIEIDDDRIRVARRVAAFNSLQSVRFESADVDSLTATSAGGPFDVVFCSGIDRHAHGRERLYRLLGELTRERLLFEGHDSTDRDRLEVALRGYFSSVEFLGYSDDDSTEKIRRRPLFRAEK